MAANPSSVSNPQLRFLLRQDSDAVKRSLESLTGAGDKIVSRLWAEKGLGGTYEDAKDQFKKDMDNQHLTKIQKDKKREEFLMQTTAALDGSGLDPNIASVKVSEAFSESEKGKREAQRRLVDTKKTDKLVDEEKKAQAVFDHTLANLGKELGGKKLGGAAYADILSKGKMSTTIDGVTYTGDELKKEMADRAAKGDKEFAQKVEKQARTEDMASLTAKRAMSQLDISAPPQKTVIEGIAPAVLNALGASIASEMSKPRPTNPPAPIVRPGG
jgi:hypothetical protein